MSRETNRETEKKAAEAQPRQRRTYHHGDLRRTLLDAAHKEIATNGAQDLTLASLARRAGVAQSAPYRHFADRDDLLSAVAMEGFQALSAALRQAVESGGDEGRFERATVAYLQFGERNV
ncbi:TetR/AcrR family transcriptional regulator, partial [Gluconobacter cerinus]